VQKIKFLFVETTSF